LGSFSCCTSTSCCSATYCLSLLLWLLLQAAQLRLWLLLLLLADLIKL
jgi:hypothetical protein